MPPVTTGTPPPPTSSAAPRLPLRVLAVDDNHDAADSLAILLRLLGHEVRTAYDGAQALAAAREFRPEVALLDLGLPGLDGLEMARLLCRGPGLGRGGMVALGGYGRERERDCPGGCG